MKTILTTVTAILFVASSLLLHVTLGQQAGVKRTELQRHDLGVPGREVVQVRVDIAPGSIAAMHSHPGEEMVYVIEGQMEYQLDDGKPAVPLKAGQTLFIPSGMKHSVKNTGRENAAELATYLVEKGKPLVTLAN